MPSSMDPLYSQVGCIGQLVRVNCNQIQRRARVRVSVGKEELGLVLLIEHIHIEHWNPSSQQGFEPMHQSPDASILSAALARD